MEIYGKLGKGTELVLRPDGYYSVNIGTKYLHEEKISEADLRSFAEKVGIAIYGLENATKVNRENFFGDPDNKELNRGIFSVGYVTQNNHQVGMPWVSVKPTFDDEKAHYKRLGLDSLGFRFNGLPNTIEVETLISDPSIAKELVEQALEGLAVEQFEEIAKQHPELVKRTAMQFLRHTALKTRDYTKELAHAMHLL